LQYFLVVKDCIFVLMEILEIIIDKRSFFLFKILRSLE